MKKPLLILLLFPFLSFGQVQIGQDIDGEELGDESGRVVSLSSDGTIVAIGAPENNGNGDRSGHVRIYENINNVWTQIGQDIDGGSISDQLGSQISLSSNGNIVAITTVNTVSGRVEVYENIDNIWTQIGQDINGEGEGDESGSAISLSSDGTIIAIGAPQNDDNDESSGHVRIYENIDNVWTQIGQDIDGEELGDESGSAVSLSSDGTIVAIGAPENDASGDRSGHVSIYENINNTWTQIGQDINGENPNNRSGSAVSLSSNGSIVAIGTSLNDDNGQNSGHVRIYENINNTWTQIGEDINGEFSQDLSGGSISLSSDGTIISIGARGNNGNGNGSGHVRIYMNQNDNWTQIGDDIDGEGPQNLSGTSVSLSSNSNVVAIGAPFNDGNGPFSGHVRVFDLSAILSTEEVTNISFKIYPNPASTNVTIQLDQNSVLEKAIIYNSLGQIVKTSTEVMIDSSDLSKGIYILEVITNQGKASKKLIIE